MSTQTDWFDNTIAYLRGDPKWTDQDFSKGIPANFIAYWDSLSFHEQAFIKAVFLAGPTFRPRAITEVTR